MENSALFIQDWYSRDHDEHFTINRYVSASYINYKGGRLQGIPVTNSLRWSWSLTLCQCVLFENVSSETFHDAAFSCTRK